MVRWRRVAVIYNLLGILFHNLQLATSALRRSPKNQSGCVTGGLTRREMLILRSLMDGASNKAIALKLVMTESTVKVHMKTILRKLRLENRTQAAIWARDHANELACDRAPLERTGIGPTIEPRPRTAANVDSRRAPAEL